MFWVCFFFLIPPVDAVETTGRGMQRILMEIYSHEVIDASAISTNSIHSAAV